MAWIDCRKASGRLQAPVPTTLNFEDGSARRIAYCPQDPVILSATARENITFGKSYDDARYHHALTQCCLDEDLASWVGTQSGQHRASDSYSALPHSDMVIRHW